MVIARSKLFLDFAELLLIIVMTKPDIVHFQWFRTFKPDYFYLRLLRLIGYRTVLTAHEVIPEFVSPEKYDRYASRLYRNFKKVIALTEPGKKELYTRYGVPEKAIHVSIIAHGDFSFFKSMAEKETDSRKRFGFREDSKIVLFFGRITYDKGLDQLLRSFKMVKERVPNARLLVAGALLESFLPYEKLICEFGLSDVVKLYLKKMVPFEEVPMCFRAADVVALPYRYSCQSGVLEVALAMGKPVVATDVGILRRVLPNGAGFIIPPGDVDLLAERLIEILRDETLLKHMSSIAGHAADQNRSWQVIARDFIGVYESICRNVAMEPDKQ
jgi:glycosyltransferase involved in cell wall biosynthesis